MKPTAHKTTGRTRTKCVRVYPSPYCYAGADLFGSREQSQTGLNYAEMKQSVHCKRVAARIGSGGLDHDTACISRNEEVSTRVENLFWHGLKLADAKEFKPEIIKDLQLVDIHGKELDWLKNVDIEKLLMRLRISVKPDPWSIHKIIDDLVRERPDDEPEVYFYHSDHLGGASWITDRRGAPVQHLQYLPFGEPFVDQHPAGYQERYTFTGKERDEETGYGYFGARYMDHEQMTMWLSVDPLADKYPNISPYNYCMWNPIRVVDPNGMDTLLFNKNGKYQKTILSKGTPVGKMKRKDGSFICFYFADPENDVKSAKDPDFRVQIVEDKTIKEYIKSTKVDKYIKLLKKIGYSNDERKYFALMFLANHSNAGTNPNDPFTLDYTCRLGLTDNILYVTKVGGEYIGHNGHNFGNFLWGASANILEVPLWIALLGAHYNNIKSKDENGGKLDSLDDQFSISLGHKWSRRNKL